MAEPSREPLLRVIGVFGLAAGIVNITVGGGIFRLPADVASSLGPAAPLAYLTVVLVMGMVVLCLAEAGSRVDLTGGPYAYLEIWLSESARAGVPEHFGVIGVDMAGPTIIQWGRPDQRARQQCDAEPD